MTGIWQDTADGLVPLRTQPFLREKDLHDSIERAPAMLPLRGQPRLVVLGREVPLGTGYADLVAMDADTGQPVIIEVKLAANSDRRSVFTQVLGYASHLFRMPLEAFEELVRPYLARRASASIGEAVVAEIADGSVDLEVFRDSMTAALEEGQIRCVVVLDTASPDLIDLAGYLQAVTNERLDIDLVTVSAYRVGDGQVLVPQLVEPERISARPLVQPPSSGRDAKPIAGSALFTGSIDSADPAHREQLRRLCSWARQLESAGLATLYTTVGKGRWVLNLRLPGQDRGMVTIWNDRGAFLSPQRSVVEAEAPQTLVRLDERFPNEVRRNNYLTNPVNQEILELFRDAYAEAVLRSSRSTE
ncbi:hypothetical protein [Planotetraspora kaengkrachanensis]|uniref:DUF91 domain-containing protein n=1 Tax=Planotetraspora kaengkrachanensis TaxID=575193 RepID=A0A8J3LX05_9ACTN|nr:hypothetical protein [Planotetraspora kaengkrachanensis]GIG80017.1 hypothetical protein Pka01_31440 [Planotetraspora kaengkrachanensis]